MALTTVYLVRHAHAGSSDHWDGDDRLRPLSARGWRQATELVPFLQSHKVDRLLTSDYTRCRQTLEPAAEALHLPIEPVIQLQEGANPNLAHTFLMTLENAAACSHGDVILGLLDHWAHQDVQMDHSRVAQKGSTWVLTLENGTLQRAQYVAPLDGTSGP